MRTITLKSVPDELYEELKASAKRNRRSLNQEALYRIEHPAEPPQRDPEAILARIRDLHRKAWVPTVDEDFIDEAKRMGRK